MFQNSKSKILVFLLLLGILYGCKRQLLSPEISLSVSKRDEIVVNATKKWYLMQEKATVNFAPVWEQAITYALANNEKLLIAPVWRYANVIYGTEFDFMRKLVVYLDAENQIKEAKITEMVTEKGYLKIHQNNAFFWWKTGLINNVIVVEYNIDDPIFELPQAPNNVFRDCASGDIKVTYANCAYTWRNGCGIIQTIQVISTDCNGGGGGGSSFPTPNFPRPPIGTTGVSPRIFPDDGTIYGVGGGGTSTSTDTTTDPGTNVPQPEVEPETSPAPPTITGDLYQELKDLIPVKLSEINRELNTTITPARRQSLEAEKNGLNQLAAIMHKIEINRERVNLEVEIDNSFVNKGATSYNLTNGFIKVRMSPKPVLVANPTNEQRKAFERVLRKYYANLAHELKHVEQYLDGKLSFSRRNGGVGVLYDANDEIEAYNLQHLLLGDSTPFTILEIQNLSVNGVLVYPNIIIQDRNTTTITSGLIREFYIRP